MAHRASRRHGHKVTHIGVGGVVRQGWVSVNGDVLGAQHGSVHSGALAGNLTGVFDDVYLEGQLWE